VRLTLAEQLQAVAFLAEKLNRTTVSITVMLPLRGISIMDNCDGGTFWEDEIAEARRTRLQSALTNPLITLQEVDAHINDDTFADAALTALQHLIARS